MVMYAAMKKFLCNFGKIDGGVVQLDQNVPNEITLLSDFAQKYSCSAPEMVGAVYKGDSTENFWVVGSLALKIVSREGQGKEITIFQSMEPDVLGLAKNLLLCSVRGYVNEVLSELEAVALLGKGFESSDVEVNVELCEMVEKLAANMKIAIPL